MKIIKHIEPPIKDKLKAHYFDRYRPSIDGNKILSSVGDQSEGREIQPGRCYDFDGVDDYIAITSPDIGTLYVSGLDENGELNTTLTIGYFTNQYQISGSGKAWNIKVWTSNAATETQKKSYTLESGLFAWYKCDEGAGINSYDSSGNGHHGIIINASESIHSTQPIYSWQNEVGYSIDSNFYIPRDESNPSKDALGDDLEYKGQVAYNALAKQSNCLYLDGIDDIIQFADTTGWNRLENDGTSELTINGNNIEGTEGSVYNLRVYDGSDNLIHLFPCSEGGGARINCVLGGTMGTLMNATLGTVWAKQDEYHFNLEHGWSSGKGFSIRPSDMPVYTDDNYRFISIEGVEYFFSYNNINNPSTGRFDLDGEPLDWNNQEGYFNFYKETISGGSGNNVLSLSGIFLSNTLTIDIEMFAGNGISISAFDGTLNEAFRQELNNRYGVGSSISAVFQTAEMFYLALSGTDETYGENYPETIGFPVGVTSSDLRQVMTDIGVSDVPFFLSEYGKFGGTGGASATWWYYGLVRAYSQSIYRLDLDGRTKIEIRNVDALATGGRSNLSGDYFKVTDRLMEKFGEFNIRSLSNGLWAHFYQVSINENHRTPASLTNHNQDTTGLPLENIAGRHHNGAETLIDFTGGVEDNPYAVERNLPTDYAFNQNYLFKDQSMKGVRESNFLVTDVDSDDELSKTLNYLKRTDGNVFQVQNATSLNLTIRTSDASPYQIDWGDGTLTEHNSNSAANHTYLEPYTGGVMIIADPLLVTGFWSTSSGSSAWVIDCKEFSIFENLERLDNYGAVFGDVKDLPRKLTRLNINNINATVSGDLSDLPPNISYLQFAVNPSNGLTGNISSLSLSLEYLLLGNGNAVTGDIAILQNYPDLYYFRVQGNSTLYGDITNIGQAVTTFYVHGNNTITGDIGTLKEGMGMFVVTGNNTTYGDIQYIPSTVTTFQNYGNNTITGDVSTLKNGIQNFRVQGNNTVYGDIVGLPDTLTVFNAEGANTITGDIGDIKEGINLFIVNGNNTLYGDLAELPSTITNFNVIGNSSISDYSGKSWLGLPLTVLVSRPATGGLSTAEVDQLLIDLADIATWSGSSQINLTGNNAPRSSASDAAVTLLQSKGVNVITN